MIENFITKIDKEGKNTFKEEWSILNLPAILDFKFTEMANRYGDLDIIHSIKLEEEENEVEVNQSANEQESNHSSQSKGGEDIVSTSTSEKVLKISDKHFLLSLIDYAVRYEFHFDLFVEMIPRFPFPFKSLRRALPCYFNLLKTYARGFFSFDIYFF